MLHHVEICVTASLNIVLYDFVAIAKQQHKYKEYDP